MSMLTSVLAGERPTVQGRLADRAVHRHFLDTTNPRPKRPSVTRRAMATSPKVVTHSELAGKGDAAPVPVVAKSALPPDVNADDETHPSEGFREYRDTTIPDGPTLGISRAGHVAIDLSILLRTRLLVTASSGGGKSYAVRRILEQTAPLVQQIIIARKESSTRCQNGSRSPCSTTEIPRFPWLSARPMRWRRSWSPRVSPRSSTSRNSRPRIATTLWRALSGGS